MDLSILPLSSGYRLSSGTQGAVPSNASGATAYAKSAGPVDVISISDNAYVGGNFTAIAGDTYWMSDLFTASTPTAQTVAGFRVALGHAGANGGTLRLDGQDVLDGITTFSAEQFARLTYTTGAGGSQTIVVAKTGTRQPSPSDGTLDVVSGRTDLAITIIWTAAAIMQWSVTSERSIRHRNLR